MSAPGDPQETYRRDGGRKPIAATESAFFEFLGVSDSILPMNIKESLWTSLVEEGADFSDPIVNIRAAARLVRRIQERILSPAVAKIASIWHFAGMERVSDNGARVADIYEARAWEEVPPRFSDETLKNKPTRREFVDEYWRQRSVLRERLQAE